jgi:hypothetical protein
MIRAILGRKVRMTNRRELLKIGLAAAALPAAAHAASLELAAPNALRFYKVLYDTRFAASAAFARRAAAVGLAVEAMHGDMTKFWYDDLHHRWKRGPAAIAGMTGYGALFCLERLAWDQRMRVVFRGEHAAAPGGRVAHRFEGPAALLPAAAAAAERPAWATAVADVVAQFPRERGASRTEIAVTALASTLPLPETLFSWVIAPVVRA